MSFGLRVSRLTVSTAGPLPAAPNAAIANALEIALGYACIIGLRRKSDQAIVSLYLSDLGLVTPRDDTPADTWFQALLTEPLSYRRSVVGSRLAGRAEFSGADLAFNLADQALVINGTPYSRKTLFETFAIDGASVEIRAVLTRWDAGLVIFKGSARSWDRARNGEVTVTLRGVGEQLDTPFQPATFLGTGAMEGPADLEGQRKPVTLGQCFNAPATLVIPGSQVYALHYDADGDPAPVEAISTVRAGGVPLLATTDYADLTALLAATTRPSGSDPAPPGTYDIEPGEYATCLAIGAIRLGAAPSFGLTADVQGGTFGGTYETLPGDMMRRVATSYGPQFTAGQIETGAVASLNASRPYVLGLHIATGREITAAEVLDLIVESIEGTWGDTPTGLLTFGAFAAPNPAASALTLDAPSIEDRSFGWLALPDDVDPAASEVTVGWGRNWSAGATLAEGTPAADRPRLEGEWQTARAENTVPEHPSARALRVNTLIADGADAAAHASLLAALYAGSLTRAAWVSSHKAQTLSPLANIRVIHDEEGIDARARVLGVSVSLSTRTVEVEAVF